MKSRSHRSSQARVFQRDTHRLEEILAPPKIYYPRDSGQIIATSHDLAPNGGLVREIPVFQVNLGEGEIF